jgi:hypothetical protein
VPCQQCLERRARINRAINLYLLLRTPNAPLGRNGRLQAAWKALGVLLGRPGVMLSPERWEWVPKP